MSQSQVTVNTLEEAVAFAERVGFPLRLNSSFSLGWHESADNMEEFLIYAQRGFELSPIKEIQLKTQKKSTERCMDLFVDKPFTSHAGLALNFKIECDALSDGSIQTIAAVIGRNWSFGKVYGIPRGGTRLAKALEPFCLPGNKITLIVDDVLTTGTSMEEAREKIGPNSIGIVIFARGTCPSWIRPLCHMAAWVWR